MMKQRRATRVFCGDLIREGVVLNISSGGLLLLSQSRRGVGEPVDLSLRVLQSRRLPVRTRVKWCRPCRGANGYCLGLAFEKVAVDPLAGYLDALATWCSPPLAPAAG